jgi:hypothetical protein
VTTIEPRAVIEQALADATLPGITSSFQASGTPVARPEARVRHSHPGQVDPQEPGID